MHKIERDEKIKEGMIEFEKYKKDLYFIGRASDFWEPCTIKGAFKVIVKGGIPDFWYIKDAIVIKDLEEFIKKYGRCILDIDDRGRLDITIYDDYIG